MRKVSFPFAAVAPHSSPIARRTDASSAIKRRALLIGLASLGLAGCTTTSEPPPLAYAPSPPPRPSMYDALPDEQFPIPAVDMRKLEPRLWRQEVDYPTPEAVGTLVVDTPNRYLYLVTAPGRALRYGIGIGRQGFTWAGRARVQYKRVWPRWTPPDEMVLRQPELEPYSIANGGMGPGLGNPLGARALYIFRDGQDTLYRLHGTNQPASIGKAVSSGCIRLLNQDVVDLHNRVPNGSTIVVVPDLTPPLA